MRAPARVLVLRLRDDDHHHVSALRAAILRALVAIDAPAIRLDPHPIHLAGNQIDFPTGKNTLRRSMTTTIWDLPARELPCAGWLDLFDPVPILQTEPGMIVLPVIFTRSNVKVE
jgi:hypothetical protein